MAIVPADIKFFHSGGAANADPDLSLGGVESSVEVSAALHNLFDLVSGAESAAGLIEYRCFYVKNTHATLTLQNAKLYISGETGSVDSELSIALAGEGLNGTAEVIGDESTPPSGEAFTRPLTLGAGLVLGNMAPGDSFAIWVKRDITAGAAAVSNDTGTLSVGGDTAA